MATVPSFWVGARSYARGPELEFLADHMGGAERMSRAKVADLLAIGVERERAEAWLAQDPETTVGQPITWADLGFPPLLRELSDPPALLYVQGNLSVLLRPAVALVGTRSCTPYGVAVARHLGFALAARGVVVVSGLARGIDTHAHRAALSEGLTVAVLGHGLSMTSPPSNRVLRREIIESGGAIVSTYPDETRPTKWTFPQRNTWIAGMAQATVVVEAPVRSGAKITATEAAAIGREVWAVPGRLGDSCSAGCLELLVDGASPIHDVEAFADRFGPRQGELIDPVLLALREGPTAQSLSDRLGLPVATVLARLATLEVQGRIVRLPGHRFGLA